MQLSQNQSSTTKNVVLLQGYRRGAVMRHREQNMYNEGKETTGGIVYRRSHIREGIYKTLMECEKINMKKIVMAGLERVEGPPPRTVS